MVGSLTEFCPQLMEIKAVSLLKKRRERFKGRTDVILATVTSVLDGLKTEDLFVLMDPASRCQHIVTSKTLYLHVCVDLLHGL